MSKISDREFGALIDPGSEEYAPTMQEIDKERQVQKIVTAELSHIEWLLEKPMLDPYSGEEEKFHVTDPEIFWQDISYLRSDYLQQVNDPELQQGLAEKITRVENKVYKQFIPFIESKINTFGWQNSPLEKHLYQEKLSTEESVLDNFERAYKFFEQSKISKEEQIMFLSEIERLKEKFDRYQKEPTLFTFERIEEELQEELLEFRDSDFYEPPKKILKSLDHEETRKERITKLNLSLAKAHSLDEIAIRMQEEKIRTRCEERAKSLLRYLGYIKAKNEASREVLTIEGELNDLFQRVANGEDFIEEDVENFRDRINEIRDKDIRGDYYEITKKLEQMCDRVARIMAGETIDEDDERFVVESVGIDWAWSLLGITRDATGIEIKQAYRQLAIKYHPDVSKKEGSAEKMQRINEAYELAIKLNKSEEKEDK